ncbi:hypothetical protein BD779DRAFT_1564113 [Infundibulicybe gibba]|nr:hypothetical protein BD779DRAFT_1564113 [Infundibulicybe gibba]
MKYFAIISALLASQAMGAVVRDTAVNCPTTTSIKLLGGLLTASINVSQNCATGLVCCQASADASGNGGGLLSGVITVTGTTGICAYSCDCLVPVPGA